MSNKNLFVEVHALQAVPPSCINRDDTGSPKTAQYGGVTRARVSSQAWKHAMRNTFPDIFGKENVGLRTRDIVTVVANAIREKNAGVSEEMATALALDVFSAAGISINAKKGASDTILFMSVAQANALADVALYFYNETPDLNTMTDKQKEKWHKGVQKEMSAMSINALRVKPSYDMALFGRMVAKPTELSVDAACQVAHAISTHSAKTEYDYYVAVDDLCDNGAAFLDAAEFNSSTLYRYAVVDVQQLSKTLAEEDDDEIAGVVSSFINSFIRSMPTGKQNSYANRTLPSMVYVTVRTDAPVSLVDAFEKPVYSTDGYMEASESRFVDFAKKKFAQFGIAPAQAYGVGDAVAAMGVDPQTVPDMLNSVKESVKNYLTEEG